MRKRSLKDEVVVITGASSGIGRQTAVEFARRGARLVLGARRKEALIETVRLCIEAGGHHALAVVTDVRSEQDVENLAHSAMRAYGRVDVWINNAGVTLFALLSEAAFEDHKHVIETNLFGAMLGARVIIPYFKAQRSGVLINVSSVLGKVGQPYVPSYVISKFGLRGLTEATRTEVAEFPDVHVCSVLPYAVDTPHFEDAGNAHGRGPRPMPPMQSPEKIARVIARVALRPRREVYVPRMMAFGVFLHDLAPRTVERLLLRALDRWHFDDRELPTTDGNVREPHSTEGAAHGQWPTRLGTPAFAGWLALELSKMALVSVVRALPRRPNPSPAARTLLEIRG